MRDVHTRLSTFRAFVIVFKRRWDRPDEVPEHRDPAQHMTCAQAYDDKSQGDEDRQCKLNDEASVRNSAAEPEFANDEGHGGQHHHVHDIDRQGLCAHIAEPANEGMAVVKTPEDFQRPPQREWREEHGQRFAQIETCGRDRQRKEQAERDEAAAKAAVLDHVDPQSLALAAQVEPDQVESEGFGMKRIKRWPHNS